MDRGVEDSGVERLCEIESIERRAAQAPEQSVDGFSAGAPRGIRSSQCMGLWWHCLLYAIECHL